MNRCPISLHKTNLAAVICAEWTKKIITSQRENQLLPHVFKNQVVLLKKFKTATESIQKTAPRKLMMKDYVVFF